MTTKRCFHVVFTIFCVTIGVTSSFAETSASDAVVCNMKTALTNVRSGPTAKGTSIIDKVPNNTPVTILEHVKNPEGTHEWLKIQFKHSQSGAETTGFIYHEGVSENCEGSDPTPNKTPIPKKTSYQPEPVFSGNGAFDISQDPHGSGDCQGVIIPYSVLNKRGILNIDLDRKRVQEVLCQDEMLRIVFKTDETYIGPMSGEQETCQPQIKFYGQRGSGENYFEGKVQIGSESSPFCDQSNLVNGEDRDRDLVRVAFFHGSQIFTTQSAYDSAVRLEADAANTKLEEAKHTADDAFTKQLRDQNGAQGLYLFAGSLERENNETRARQAYEYIISSYPATDWAVKANDRLLQMKASSDAAQQSQEQFNQYQQEQKKQCEQRRAECFTGCQAVEDYSAHEACNGSCPYCD